MSFYGNSSKYLIEKAVSDGVLQECQITSCDLEDLLVSGVLWKETNMQDLNANGIVFKDTKCLSSNFFQVSMMDASFNNSSIEACSFKGLSLIRSKWLNTRIENLTLELSTLQRSSFSHTNFINSRIIDIEAGYTKVDSCIFKDTDFDISYGSGMNGFAQAVISNTFFYNCTFSGYPLRGAQLENCIFCNCSGQIGDEIIADNVYGLGLNNTNQKKIDNLEEAQQLLNRFSHNGV